ncbi:MAG: glycosyltransferase family 4 protein [Longimicrobiales bacterium]
MPRILYVEANEDGTVGGSHKVCVDLITRLSDRYEPVMLFYEDNVWTGRLRARGIEVVTWDEIRAIERQGLKEGGKLSTATALARGVMRRRSFLREKDIDMVHLNNSPFVGYDDWLPAARLARVPCVAYGHGGLGYEPNPLRRLGITGFDAYFPVSELVRDAFARNGVPPSRMTLTYPGLDLEEEDARTFRPADEVRAEFGLAPDQLLVTMVGNIRQWKGQHVVVDALSRLSADERRRIHVLFVGQQDGHEDVRAELDRAIDAHGLGDVVEFTGRREDVPDLLEATDIAVHASVAPEPFGLVVLEAMLHGCAVVAANRGGPKEMMSPESGRSFDPDRPEELTDHLRALMADPDLRARYAAAARVRARTFDVRRHVTLIEREYERLM